MPAPLPRLIAAGFLKSPSDIVSLKALEALLTFGVFHSLGQLMDIQTQDVAPKTGESTGEAPGDSAGEFTTDALSETSPPRLRQLATAHRAQFVWTGTLSAGMQDNRPVFQIVYRLYDAGQDCWLVDETVCLPKGGAVEPHIPPVEIAAFNALIQRAAMQCRDAITQDKATVSHRPSDTPPDVPTCSTSLSAMYWAMRAHQARRMEEKIAFYEAALREDTRMEWAYARLARLYKSDHAYEKSVRCYREALRYAEGSPRSRAVYATEAGVACALLGKTDVGVQWWLQAIAYDPSFLNPYFNLANTYEDQDNLRDAERYFLQAQRLAPEDFRIPTSLARIYSRMGAWEKALRQYQRQLEMDRLTMNAEDPWCHSDVATCHLNLGNTTDALQHLQKTVSLDPEGEAGQYAQLILEGLAGR